VTCDLEKSGPEWVIEHPKTLDVFRALGVDYCCGGKSLEHACREHGLDSEIVLAKLRSLIADGHTT
jgi:regulator of cell morphogenesis and NO signaling